MESFAWLIVNLALLISGTATILLFASLHLRPGFGSWKSSMREASDRYQFMHLDPGDLPFDPHYQYHRDTFPYFFRIGEDE